MGINVKKIIGILGTITITGSGILGIVGNKPYSTKENNKIRIKRQDNNSFRITVIKGILIITDSVNWGENFVVQINSQACSAIKSAGYQALKEAIRYLKNGSSGAIPGVYSGYIYNKISNSSKIYSYQETPVWDTSFAAGSITTTLQSDIKNGIINLYNYWEENPQHLIELVSNYYEQGQNLLISFTNNGSIPDLVSVVAGIGYETNINNNNLERRWGWPWDSNTNDKIDIKVPAVRQQTGTWCGPAVAEAVLRTFRWNSNANIENNNNIQQELAAAMRANDNSGTPIENVEFVINNFFQRNWNNDLNIDVDVSPPQYSLTRIHATERRMGFSTAEEVNFIQTINNIIRTSLKAGVPVILEYSGNLPPRSSIRCENDDYHYILINGISEPTGDIFETRYSYMDPQVWISNYDWRAELRQDLTARDFGNLFWGGNNRETGEELYQNSHLLSYIPSDNIQNETNFPDTDDWKNKFSMMALGLCYYNSKLNNRNKRSVNNNKISTCSVIDKNNPYYDKENDLFKIKHHWTGHNGLEVKLSLKTAQVIEKIYFEKNELEFKEYLTSLFKKIKFDNTGYSHSDTDYEYPADILYWGFPFFHKEVINLIRNGNPENKSIFIETRRTYNWFDLSSDDMKKVIYSSKNSKSVFD